MTDRLERLTNLVATLLDTRRPLTLEEIVELVPGYPDDKMSYRRQFERDKDTLRGIGIPVRLEGVDSFGPEQGYRIPPDEYYLPSLDLSSEEQAALLDRALVVVPGEVAVVVLVVITPPHQRQWHR